MTATTLEAQGDHVAQLSDRLNQWRADSAAQIATIEKAMPRPEDWQREFQAYMEAQDKRWTNLLEQKLAGWEERRISDKGAVASALSTMEHTLSVVQRQQQQLNQSVSLMTQRLA